VSLTPPPFQRVALSLGDEFSEEVGAQPTLASRRVKLKTGLELVDASHWMQRCDISETGLVLSCGGDRTVRLWDLADGGACLKQLDGHADTVFNCSMFNECTKALSGGNDNRYPPAPPAP
jgi:WD40 repeat protein